MEEGVHLKNNPILPNTLRLMPAKFHLPCTALSTAPAHPLPLTPANPAPPLNPHLHFPLTLPCLLTLRDPTLIKCSSWGSPWGTKGRETPRLPHASPSLYLPPIHHRNSELGWCWGLRSPQTIEQSGQHHGDSEVSSWWCLQGSYLGALGTQPWTPTFRAPRSPALMAASHRRRKINWGRL